MNESTYVITFQSTHAAMAASHALKVQDVIHYTIPTPREISAGCGIALRFLGEPELVKNVWQLFVNEGLSETDMALHLVLAENEYLPLEL